MSLIYLAGPIGGLSYDDAVGWREHAAKWLSERGISSASPMRFKSFLATEKAIKDHYDHTLANPRAIYTRDRWDVSRCDLIIANLLGAEKVSIGTVLEIGWADMFKKPIILVMEPGNIHDHAMINECAGYVVSTITEALEVAQALLVVD